MSKTKGPRKEKREKPPHPQLDFADSHPQLQAPIEIIRTESQISKLPIHNLSKKTKVDIKITKKNALGETELFWKVSPNPEYGPAGQLAYQVDTILINRRLDEIGRPAPQIIPIGSLYQICKDLGVQDSGKNKADIKRALHQNAGTYITADLIYNGVDGSERRLNSGFTRYSVIFVGERLPDGRQADSIYILLNEVYRQVINNSPTRPLDFNYLRVLPPAAQRCYEIISYRIYAALKHDLPYASITYSDYCTYAAMSRYEDYRNFRKQMDRIHQPHLQSGYIQQVDYEKTVDPEGKPDWNIKYVPGPKAREEFRTFNAKPIEAGGPSEIGPGGAQHNSSPPEGNDRPKFTAEDLVNYFHQRWHRKPQKPSATELQKAAALLEKYPAEFAKYLVDYAVAEAPKTNFQMLYFGAILSYEAKAAEGYEKRAGNKTERTGQSSSARANSKTSNENNELEIIAAAIGRAEQRLADLNPDQYKALADPIIKRIKTNYSKSVTEWDEETWATTIRAALIRQFAEEEGINI